jgi:mannose-6-phosphate isomerase-like protein (cupin superfamily)
VTVKIVADTRCAPHGAVAAGEIVTVPWGEYHSLKAAGKAIKATAEEIAAARAPKPEVKASAKK